MASSVAIARIAPARAPRIRMSGTERAAFFCQPRSTRPQNCWGRTGPSSLGAFDADYPSQHQMPFRLSAHKQLKCEAHSSEGRKHHDRMRCASAGPEVEAPQRCENSAIASTNMSKRPGAPEVDLSADCQAQAVRVAPSTRAMFHRNQKARRVAEGAHPNLLDDRHLKHQRCTLVTGGACHCPREP